MTYAMKIRHGLLAGQVIQRDRNNRGRAWIKGICRAAGAVEIRVLKKDRVLRGHNWAFAGCAGSRRFEAVLDELPAGGPYRVELRISAGRKTVEHAAVDNIFVGDVWILAGQSNMQGVGNMEDAPRSHPLVRCFRMRDEWAEAEEPTHFMPEAVDIFHNGYGDGPGRPPRGKLEKQLRGMLKGTSPGLAFGLEMRKRTGVPQGLIACAHGGTSMALWSPELRDQGGASLYGAMMRRYEKLGQPVAGILWYQGESDSNETDTVTAYTANMEKLVAATRRDMNLPRLPWVIVQLGRHTSLENGHFWNEIQNRQRLLPSTVPNLDVVPAIDLELDDGIHISGKAHHLLGARLARAANRLVHKAPGAKSGIVLKSITTVPTPPWSMPHMQSVELTFGNVAGKLQSQGLPAGFALIDAEGKDTCQIYKTTLHGRRVLLHTGLPPEQLAGLSVRYGHGRLPYCNITDAEGMSIPALTVPLPKP